MWDSTTRHRHVQVAVPDAAPRRRDQGAALRRVRRARSAAGRSKASRTPPAPGSQFDWFRSRMLGGRTNHWGRISLRFGPHDFRAQEPRRPRRRLADHLRRHQAVLRQDRPADRHLRRQPLNMPNEPDGIFLPPPKPRCYELLIKKASRQAERPERAVAAVDPDPAAQRPAGLPLLRPVRPRLRDALELLVAVGADSAGAEDRQAEDHLQRDGPRGDGRRGTGWPPASPTSTRPPSATTTSARASSCWRRARASRRASCSTRSRRSSRRGSATRAATSAST